MATSQYPALNDREFDLQKKIANNTALIVDTGGGGGGSGTVTHTTGALTSGSIIVGNGSGDIKPTTTGTGIVTALGVNAGSAGAPVINGGALGTPSSGVATNLTGTAAGLTAGTASAVAVGGITGLGTGVATALAVNVGSAGAPVVLNGAGGTPSAMVGTNITGTAAGLTAGAATNGVTSSSTFGTDNVILRSDGTSRGSQSSGATIDDSNNISTAGSISAGVGGSVAGALELAQGTAPTAGTTSVKIFAPAAVTSWIIKLPAATGTGLWLGTDSSGTETITRVTPGTGVTTAIAVNVGSAGAFVTNGGALGTPSSGTLTNATGLPASSLVAGTLPASSLFLLGENSSIGLDPAGSADGKFSGITVTGVGGATIAFGDLVTLDKDDSRWELVDISVAAAATGDARGIIGIAATSSTDGTAITVLLNGIIRADANFPTLTIGAAVYASTTGDVVVTQPTTTDHVIRIVGYGLTADEMYFNPTGDWTTHT